MQPRNNSSGPAERVVTLLVKCGWVPDGETRSQQFRSGSSANPLYGGIGGEVSFIGGRMRFRKPDSPMKATVGKLTTCFYEVEDGATFNAVSIKTRETDRITRWARTEVCFRRSDAVRRGREAEWIEKNAWLLDDPEVVRVLSD